MAQNTLSVSGSIYDVSGYEALGTLIIVNPNLNFVGGTRVTLSALLATQVVTVPVGSFGCLAIPKGVPSTMLLSIQTAALSVNGLWLSTWDLLDTPGTLTLVGTGTGPGGVVEFLFF